jgi:hypothetical protein
MTTVSAVIFLYEAYRDMDAVGQASAAAATAVTILAATTLAKIAESGAASVVNGLVQSWRRRRIEANAPASARSFCNRQQKERHVHRISLVP